MFDCAGYVFGSGLVFHSGKKKGGGGEKGAAFAALNPASGGEESLTACHLKAGRGPAPLCFSLYRAPGRRQPAVGDAPCPQALLEGVLSTGKPTGSERHTPATTSSIQSHSSCCNLSFCGSFR